MFCGGGSAGHVMPNFAIMRALQGRYEVEYMGTDGIESALCRGEGIKFFTFAAPKFVRGKICENLAIPFRLKKSVACARDILLKEKPGVLFCKGGYVSLPPALAAKKLGIPVIAHESDFTPGLANKIISRFAEVTLTSFPETAERFARGRYAGAPIRKEACKGGRARAMEKFGLDARPTVIVFGGGSGSAAISAALRQVIPQICAEYNVLHICGRGNKIESAVHGYVQIEFERDMGAVYACADCAVARSGSNSAFELMANRIPTLFIPLENRATRGDQLKNAQYFAGAGLCRILRQRELTPEKLKDEIFALMNDREIKRALSGYNFPRGNEKIAAEIERVAIHGKSRK